MNVITDKLTAEDLAELAAHCHGVLKEPEKLQNQARVFGGMTIGDLLRWQVARHGAPSEEEETRANPVDDFALEFRSEGGGIGSRLVAYWPMDGDQDAPAVKRDPHYKGSTRQDFYDGAAGGEESDGKTDD